jgi:pilus assembly protein CpaF
VITPLLHDDSITEIMVNGIDRVYVERAGKLERADCTFASEADLLRVIKEVAAFVGRRIDEDSPMVDARLPDGSRVNAIIPPLSLEGPSLTIRKFAKDPYSVLDLIRFGTLTEAAAAFLQACVAVRLNIIVSGGTGSGKTTTLNVLSEFIPEGERVVTIEDAAELQIRQEHRVRLESRPPNLDGKNRVTIRDLVGNALRMRPDRIIIGECRGGEALDMLQAMNTGHDGSLTTIHANTPRDAMARLETLVLMSGVDLPQRAIREQIASAIHLIVQQSRLRDGSRRITSITEILGREGETITMQEVFLFEETGVDAHGKLQGQLVATGIRPKAMAKVYSQRLQLAPALASLYPDRKSADFTVGVKR